MECINVSITVLSIEKCSYYGLIVSNTVDQKVYILLSIGTSLVDITHQLAQWLGYVGEVLKKDIKFKLIFLPSCSILIRALVV